MERDATLLPLAQNRNVSTAIIPLAIPDNVSVSVKTPVLRLNVTREESSAPAYTMLLLVNSIP